MRAIPLFLALALGFLSATGQVPTDSLARTLQKVESSPTFAADTNYLKAINALAFGYWSSKPDSLIYLCRQNAERCRRANFSTGMVDAYKNIGVAYWVKGDYTQALEYYQQGLSLAQKINYRKGMGRVLLNISLVYSDQGKYPEALDYNFKSLKICEAINDGKGQALNYNNVAIIYFNQMKYNEALSYYKKSLAISEASGNQQDIAMATSNIAELYVKQENYPEAMKYYLQSLKLKENVGDLVGLSTNYGGLGEIHKRQQNYTLALDYYFKAWKIQQTIGNKPDMAVLLLGIGDCYYSLKQYPRALEYCQKGLGIAMTIGHKKFIRDGHEIASKIYKATNRFDLALAHYEKFKHYSDSLINQESERKSAMLESQYLFDKKELELKTDQARREAEHKSHLAQQQLWINVFAIGFVFVVVLALLLYRNNRQKQMTNQVLVQKNVEISQQKERLENMDTFKNRLLSVVSHDVRGPLNSVKGMFFLFNQKALTAEETTQLWNNINGKITQVAGFVDDLLLWAKNQMAQPQIKKVQFSLADVIRPTVALLQGTAEAKKIKITHNIDEALAVLADEEMIKVVIRNLVSNAIKFCRENDEIKIIAKNGVKPGEVMVSVIDTGTGIASDKLARLFDTPYESTKGTDNEVGTGLGLMLCKQFIELNHGTIGAESKPGTGSHFWITLPAYGAQ